MAQNAFDDLVQERPAGGQAPQSAQGAQGNAFADLIGRSFDAPEPERAETARYPVVQPQRMPQNRTGGRIPWRVAVSVAETPEDQAATLRNIQQQAGVEPDAQWVTVDYGRHPGAMGAEATPLTEDALIYTNPETGRTERFDPGNLEDIAGDLAEAGIPLARVLAYGLGLAGGTAATRSAAGGHAAGVAMSQGVKYGAEPVVEYLTGVDIPDTRSIGEQVLEGAVDVGLEAGLPPAAGSATRAGQRAARAPLRRRMFGGRAPGRPEVVRDIEGMAAAQGVPSEPAMRAGAPLVTESEQVKQLWRGMERDPQASQIIRNAADDLDELVSREFERVHGRTGGMTEPVQAGSMIRGMGRDAAEAAQERAGMTARPLPPGGITERLAFRNMRQGALEDQVEKHVGGETMVEASNTWQLIAKKIARAKGGGGQETVRDVVPEQFQRLFKDLQANDGKLSFALLRDYRQRIGPKAGKGKVLTSDDPSVGEYKQLYGALTADLRTAAEQKGGAAAEAWEQAQKHYAQTEALFEQVRAVADSGSAEEAFRAAISGAKQGPSMLQALRSTLGEEAWDALVSVKLWEEATTAATSAGARGRLTRVFSPTQYVRNWRNMKPSVKDLLYARGTRLREELDRLARVSARIEESQKYLNPSGTAQANIAGNRLRQGLVTFLFGHRLARGQARLGFIRRALGQDAGTQMEKQAALMTDPDFVRWLADGMDLLGAGKAGPTKLANHVQKLVGLAAGKEPYMKAYILDVVQGWEEGAAPEQDVELPAPPETTSRL